ncbi:MAG: DUF1028 domain-containing protein [Deltaproteobacteria bacterium]|nr:DUF1028 domain-containing protein [Deltaproteobacteria bacterium]
MKFREESGIPCQALCHTYSIAARDPATGQLGVAVQSHYFCVGGLVTWAEAGVGVVATQAITDPAYGPRGLELMRAGSSAPEALAKLAAADPGRDIRQVGMVDSQGRAAAHTGSLTIAEAGHIVGDGFSVQANMMLRNTVWAAMADAYRSTPGELVDRLLAALDAAEAEGGDIRGRQSAALLIVPAKPSGRAWPDKIFDIRVDDAREPLAELRRLAGISRAYEHMRLAQAALARGDSSAMSAEFEQAAILSGDNPEMRFWQAVALIRSERIGEGLAILAKIAAVDANWRELALRLPQVMLPDNREELLERIRKLS